MTSRSRLTLNLSRREGTFSDSDSQLYRAALRAAAPYAVADDSTGPEGITADIHGNMYGAEFTMDVKKYVQK